MGNMGMIERVARALCSKAGYLPDSVGVNGFIMWERYKREAIAAIQAMREPSEGVVKAGGYEVGPITNWQAMIAAALAETGE